MLSISLAVLAALANATASVLQRQATRDEPDRKVLNWRLLWDLVHRPVWIAGILVIVVGVVLQAGALGTGRISVVQPLLVLELPFALILASLTLRSRLHAREWLSAAGMAAGLALLLYALSPSGGSPEAASLLEWGLGIAAALGLVAAFAWWGLRKTGAYRAAMLGIATGVVFGLVATLIGAIAETFTSDGIAGVATAWQTYLFVVLGPVGFFLLQNALQAGRLVASQPALTLSNPIVAVAWGVVLFSEEVRTGPWLVGAVAGAGLIGTCTVLLSHSPLLQGQSGQTESRDADRQPRA